MELNLLELKQICDSQIPIAKEIKKKIDRLSFHETFKFIEKNDGIFSQYCVVNPAFPYKDEELEDITEQKIKKLNAYANDDLLSNDDKKKAILVIGDKRDISQKYEPDMFSDEENEKLIKEGIHFKKLENGLFLNISEDSTCQIFYLDFNLHTRRIFTMKQNLVDFLNILSKYLKFHFEKEDKISKMISNF